MKNDRLGMLAPFIVFAVIALSVDWSLINRPMPLKDETGSGTVTFFVPITVTGEGQCIYIQDKTHWQRGDCLPATTTDHSWLPECPPGAVCTVGPNGDVTIRKR